MATLPFRQVNLVREENPHTHRHTQRKNIHPIRKKGKWRETREGFLTCTTKCILISTLSWHGKLWMDGPRTVRLVNFCKICFYHFSLRLKRPMKPIENHVHKFLHNDCLINTHSALKLLTVFAFGGHFLRESSVIFMTTMNHVSILSSFNILWFS